MAPTEGWLWSGGKITLSLRALGHFEWYLLIILAETLTRQNFISYFDTFYLCSSDRHWEGTPWGRKHRFDSAFSSLDLEPKQQNSLNTNSVTLLKCPDSSQFNLIAMILSNIPTDLEFIIPVTWMTLLSMSLAWKRMASNSDIEDSKLRSFVT